MKDAQASCCSASRAGMESAIRRELTIDESTPIEDTPGYGETEAVGGRALLTGGDYLMGTDDAEGFLIDGEGPVRNVRVAPFAISPTAVTNAEFARFVESTGYRTEAETFGWSFVFHSFVQEEAGRHVLNAAPGTPWWLAVEGADWRRPEGPGSSAAGREDHPVVHASWNDAAAYCRWAGGRLPTEEEWEYAARGGLARKRYPWGDELKPGGEHRCNIWQGKFPTKNNASDGYEGTAPVRTYQPNGYGLYQMSGNVWEWCANDFDPASRRRPGPAEKAMRGGSYLCHVSYCNRYRVAARSKNTPDSSSGNIGFRICYDN